VINQMDTPTYFNLMAKLMGGPAPPAAEDAPISARMAKIGLVPGKPFDPAKLDPAVQAALKDLNKIAMKRIEENRKVLGVVENGWVVTKGLGRYGTDYVKRAVVAAFGWPANLQEDAVYPYTEVDNKGQKLTGANKYTLTFPKGQAPPVKGFWSITMYMIDQGWWFVPNPLNKFTVSPRDKLKFNADGSLTLYFQHDSPGKAKEANWLPAPKGDFILMLRLYWPQETPPSIIDGTWKPPAVQMAAGPAKAAGKPAPKKPLSRMTCEDFLALDETFQPKVVYWAVAYGKGGKPEAAVLDVEGIETIIPSLVEECKKAPKASFWQKVKQEIKKLEKKL
jgi:hypothetical protein